MFRLWFQLSAVLVEHLHPNEAKKGSVSIFVCQFKQWTAIKVLQHPQSLPYPSKSYMVKCKHLTQDKCLWDNKPLFFKMVLEAYTPPAKPFLPQMNVFGMREGTRYLVQTHADVQKRSFALKTFGTEPRKFTLWGNSAYQKFIPQLIFNFC